MCLFVFRTKIIISWLAALCLNNRQSIFKCSKRLQKLGSTDSELCLDWKKIEITLAFTHNYRRTSTKNFVWRKITRLFYAVLRSTVVGNSIICTLIFTGELWACWFRLIVSFCVCFWVFLTRPSLFVIALVILCFMWIIWLFLFSCQYQCNRLPGKTRLRNDLGLLCKMWNCRTWKYTTQNCRTRKQKWAYLDCLLHKNVSMTDQTAGDSNTVGLYKWL